MYCVIRESNFIILANKTTNSRNRIVFTIFHSFRVTFPDPSKGDSPFKPHANEFLFGLLS